MHRFLRDNALSLVLALLFLLVLGGQTVIGRVSHNEDQRAHGDEAVGMAEYLRSGHYLEAVFENWESEFLQMGLYVFLTAFLVQRGSAESKKPRDELAPGEEEEIDEDPAAHRHDPDAPGPVRRGGLALRLYQNSLTIAFLLLFIASFVGHGIGGALEYNQEQAAHGEPTTTVLGYMGSSRFWFESLQNWQSEFLAVLSIVVLSIFLRQKGSPESKPVHAPHARTGSG